MDWIIGAVAALLVSGAAYRRRSLTLSGCAAAVIMGTVYYGAGNLFWFGTLLLFFVTSTALSKYKQGRKSELEKSYAKTGNRDAGQVLANGGIGMLLCILNFVWPHPVWALFFIGVMATVTSDTWATEIGSLSRKPPRSILNGKVMQPGTSGGISWLGTGAALVGGMTIGIGAWLFQLVEGATVLGWWEWLLIGGVAGMGGAFTDSYLGATVQLMHRCKVCGREVEVERHCGQETLAVRGWGWMSNDAVNLLSSVVGGALALLALTL